MNPASPSLNIPKTRQVFDELLPPFTQGARQGHCASESLFLFERERVDSIRGIIWVA